MGKIRLEGDTVRRLSIGAIRKAGSTASILMLLGGFLFRAPSALAAPAHQTSGTDEAGESVEAQEGIDELDGQNHDAQVDEAEEGIDELDGQNDDEELNEGQEDVEEQEGQDGDSQSDEDQVGENEVDGQHAGEVPETAPTP